MNYCSYSHQNFPAIIIISYAYIVNISCFFIQIAKGNIENVFPDLRKPNNLFNTSFRTNAGKFIIQILLIDLI